MKILVLVTLLTAIVSMTANAHSGGTDKKGGHKCSQKSKNKGLCSGYHYHSKKTNYLKPSKPTKAVGIKAAKVKPINK